MNSALEEKVKACAQCQSNQKMPAPAPLHPWEWPGRPWSRLHLDFAGPFIGHMFLVLVDAHSKWLDAHIMSNITAPVTIEKLRSIFATHGLPDSVVTDNGPTFTSELFQEFMEKNGIRHVRTAPYHPASNGLAERAVETLKDGLRKMSGHTLETKLSRFLFQYRITPHTTTGISPAEMLMGRKPKSHLDLLHPDVGARVVRSQEEQKGRRDQHAKERLLSVGTVCLPRTLLRVLPGCQDSSAARQDRCPSRWTCWMDGRSAGTRITCVLAVGLKGRGLRVLHARTVWTARWLILRCQ